MVNLPSVSRPVSPSVSRPVSPPVSRPKLQSKSLPVLSSTNNSMVPTNRRLPSKSLPVLPVAPRKLLRYQDYIDTPLENRDFLYISKPKTPSSSSQNLPTNSRLSPNPNNNNKPKSVGGVNLTPLISALLLAGIKLALEQKKIAKTSKATKTAKTAKASKATKTAKTSKATKTTRRRKTI